MMYQIGWFSTGRDKAARDLLRVVYQNITSGEIKARLTFVFCSREEGENEDSDLFIKQVQEYSIPLVSFSYQKFKSKKDSQAKSEGAALPLWRLEYDREVMKRLDHFQPDLCVLAGYMLILGEEMCQRYDMINLHPAAPDGPGGTWQEVIWQLIGISAQKTGVMMHLVTPELDKGPAVTYCTFTIKGKTFTRHWRGIAGKSVEEIKKTGGENNPLFNLIRQHGLARELPLITSTLKAFSEGKVEITHDKRAIDSEGQPIKGYDLTGEIDKAVKGILKR